jgi:hypothetical protein
VPGIATTGSDAPSAGAASTITWTATAQLLEATKISCFANVISGSPLGRSAGLDCRGLDCDPTGMAHFQLRLPIYTVTGFDNFRPRRRFPSYRARMRRLKFAD